MCESFDLKVLDFVYTYPKVSKDTGQAKSGLDQKRQ